MDWISNMIFESNDSQILFGMFQGFKKATPYGGANKLRLTLPPVCREGLGMLKNYITGLDFAVRHNIYHFKPEMIF